MSVGESPAQDLSSIVLWQKLGVTYNGKESSL